MEGFLIRGLDLNALPGGRWLLYGAIVVFTGHMPHRTLVSRTPSNQQ